MSEKLPETDAVIRTDRSLDLSPSSKRHPVLVIQMHGEPGSGKSTIARAVGSSLDAVVIDKDVIKAALLRVGIAEQQAAAGAYEVFFAQASAFVAAGHSIILDNPVYWATVERRWLEISDAAGSPRILIECTCPDREALLHRLRTRDALESQPREPLNLDRYEGIGETMFEPRLTLDTTRPLDDLVADALNYIERALTTDGQRMTTATP
jgi:predicted kinase